MNSTIVPTEHEKREWSRLAHWAYTHNENDLGHRFSMAAALRMGEAAPTIAWFDALQDIYRTWLCFGLPAQAITVTERRPHVLEISD